MSAMAAVPSFYLDLAQHRLKTGDELEIYENPDARGKNFELVIRFLRDGRVVPFADLSDKLVYNAGMEDPDLTEEEILELARQFAEAASLKVGPHRARTDKKVGGLLVDCCYIISLVA
jgi:hypothetical protein